MLRRYFEVLSIPGALGFSLAGVVARAPMSMVGISLVLMVRLLYGNFATAGAVSAVSVVSFAIGAPILAGLVDRYGQLQVMLPSILISAATLVTGVVLALNLAPIPYLMVAASISGLTSGSMGALVRARWARIVNGPGQLQAAYALEAAFDELVFVLGPVAATLLTASVHPAAGLITAVILMLSGSITLLLQTKTQPPVGLQTSTESKRSVMRNPAMLVLVITFAGTGALFGSSDLSVVAFADELGMSQLAGVLLAVMSAGSLLSAVAYGAVVWKMPMWRLFLVSVGLLAAGVSTFYFAPSLWVLLIFMFIAGLTIAPTLTNVNTIVEKIIVPERLTEGLTWMSTGLTLGVAFGSAIAGPVIDVHGHRGGFFLTLLFGWIMFFAALVGVRVVRRSLQQAALEGPSSTPESSSNLTDEKQPPGNESYDFEPESGTDNPSPEHPD